MTVASHNLRLAEITFAVDQSFRYVYTAGGFRICHKCCGSERKRFALDPLWLIKADNVNKTPYSFRCDNCGGLIEPRIDSRLNVTGSLSRKVTGSKPKG